MEEKTEHKSSLNAVKSALRTMSTRETTAPSKANKARGHLEKRHYLHVLCGSKTHSHSQTVHFAFLLTLFTLRRTCVIDRPKNDVPHLLIHTCWFKGHGDARKAYTANTYT